MKKAPIRNRIKKWSIIAVSMLVLLVLLYFILSILAVNGLIDLWWFDSLGYLFYYWRRFLYRYMVFGSVSLIFFLIFFLNFWIASRVLKRPHQNGVESDKKAYQKIIKAFQKGSLLFYVPLSLLLSIPLALPVYHNWETFLFYIFGRMTGIKEQLFGNDVSFYLFSYPVYSLLQQRLLLVLLVLLAGLFLLYMVKNRLLTKHLLHFSGIAKWHLAIIILIFLGLEIWGLMLQRYDLVYDAGHQPLFSGPGFVQMKVVVPLIWASIGLIAMVTASLIFVLLFRKGYKFLIVVVAGLALSLTLRHTSFLPQFVQSYWVKPNEIAKESPYISNHILATLNAYNLAQVDIREFNIQRFPIYSTVTAVRNVLRNIPVWDAETLEAVFQQLQELRTYYTFPQVSVGRYTVGGQYQQVYMALRELDYGNLPGGSKNWINDHLLYTHGYGAVMTPASQISGDPITWFIHNIPPESEYGFSLEQPRIYFGLEKYPYALVPNKVGELDYPKGGTNMKTQYQGRGGIPISSWARKFLFAYYFRDKNIFLSSKIDKQSKVLFRRQIIERIEHLAPFLLLDQTPYAAVTSKGLFWIVDAYTTSKWYPAAASVDFHGISMNYIRNSVKIIVDAYHGSVDFYIYDENDPIIAAYSTIYPGLFKDKASIPPELKSHLRYPKDMFDMQMQIYAKYHQTDPQVFFQQEDLWTFAEALGEETTVPLKPYYLTLDLIAPGQLDFILLLPMFPKGRDNLRSMAVVGCDGDNYGKIIIYDFPKGELVYGPAQIDALINQDPDIAQQFTLWDQAGSTVVRGKMIILPVENSVLFIQPVYLKATSRVKIPELQRIIMSEGKVAVMETSLEDAYTKIRDRVKMESRGIEKRFPKLVPPEKPPQTTLPEEEKKIESEPASGAPNITSKGSE